MHDVLRNLHSRSELDFPFVLITVAHTVASAPRESGTKLLVSADKTIGTIGGGNLEYTAIQKAREILSSTSSSEHKQFVELYALGPMLEQCCGGVVFLHYELVREASASPHIFTTPDIPRVTVRRSGNEENANGDQQLMLVSADEETGSLGDLTGHAVNKARDLLKQNSRSSFTVLESLENTKGVLPELSDVLLFDVIIPGDFHLVVYGAGHVGSAIVHIMAAKPACKITWVDSRADLFPAVTGAGVTINSDSPLNTVAGMPADSYFLVMTHDHGLDRDLCEAILKRDDFQFLGLIGSKTKLRRFTKYFRQSGFSEAQLANLTCPIGIDGIQSKEPSAIAVSVSAQLLQLEERRHKRELLSHTEQVPLKVAQQGSN